jgi:S-DNA-T family DNA segregation ATPase FtsK/SpoIIIE
LARKRRPKKKRKKKQKQGPYSQFRMDIIGVFLIAFAAFILVSNLSSATGLVGFYVVKTFLKSGFGVGVYVLPFFLILLGIIVMIRQDVTKFMVRFAGLFLAFFTFILAAQLYAPDYFSVEATPFSGGGGVIGYGLGVALERVIGVVGSYIVISAAGVISLLLIFNTTIINILSGLIEAMIALFSREEEEEPRRRLEAPQTDRTLIPSMMPVIKDMQSQRVEVIDDYDEEEGKKHPVKSASPKRRKKRYSGYQLPSPDLLDLPTAKELQREERLKETTELRKKILEEALRSFGVAASVVNVNQGPAVTRYELQPEPGVKVSKIANLADDIALNLASHGVRIEAPVPGKSVVGIEVPNSAITPVRLGEIVRTSEFKKSPSKLFMGLGEDLSGTPIFGDLSRMPHLLIAGTTGSGKSVCINSLIVSILLKARPDEVKFIMIDPKMVELSIYNDIPHLLAPVVTDARRAALTLKEWVMKEMERRYRLFHENGARNIHSYNSKVSDPEDSLPFLVVIVDELADLMMAAAADVETSICRIAQMARATGIHLIIATQRPSVDVITGLIKANIPSRISFAVATQIDSRVILDQSGAEKLLGRGDMLYHPVGAMKSTRLQGSFVTDSETEKVINFVKDQAAPEYLDEITELKLEMASSSSKGGGNGRDALFAEAAKILIESGQASTSHLQRRLRIGYNRAARLMDEIEDAGIVSKSEGENKPRRILASRETLRGLGIE